MEKILSELGLSKNESKIYLALLKYGSMQLKDITKTTNLYRQNSLESIDKLNFRGLISISYAGKRKIYSAVSPERLRILLEEKEKRLESILPELLSITAQAQKPKIEIFSGREGLKTILNDEIAVGKTMHAIQSPETVEALTGDYLSISRERRWRAGITMKIIYSNKDKKYGEKAKKYPKTQVRYLDEDLDKVTTDVYGDRTVLVFGSKPTILRIIDAEVARRFLRFWKLNWEKAKS
jgi:sugar-specific transcriptional regulator TrmB